MISDEIRQQQKKLKDMTLKEKAGYIIYYYKWHILICLAVAAAAFTFIFNIVTRKEDIFFLEVINANVALDGAGDLLDPYRQAASGFDAKKQQMTADYCYVDINGGDYMSMATDQKVTAMLTVGSIDAMITTPPIMEKYKATECYADLGTILPEDLQKRLEEAGYEYYYAKITDGDTGRITDVPIGVIISNTPVMKSGYIDNNGIHQNYYDIDAGTFPVYSIMYNSPHRDEAVSFLRFLTDTP